MAALAGRFSDAEGLIALKDFMNQLGCETVCVEERFPNIGASYVYLFYFENLFIFNILELIFVVIIYLMVQLLVLNKQI
jgi:hypothetical protein